MINDRWQFIKRVPWLGILVWALAACSPGAARPTAPIARVATQTPWIIYMPVTNTPEPPMVTPLPTITAARPPRTATRVATARPAAPTKTLVKRTATIAPTPVVVVPPTAAPACSAGSIRLLFPEDGAPRATKQNGPGPDTFVFKWVPLQEGNADASMGYRISIVSKAVGTTKQINSDAVYVSHDTFMKNGQQYIYNANAVHGLVGSGDSNVTVFWNVTVVKTTGTFDDKGGVTGSVIDCGPPSQTWTISLTISGL